MKNEKKVKNQEMDIVFILDRSGSMANVVDDTIGGYNSYLEKQMGKNVKVTTVLFDDKYEMINKRENIKNVKKLDNNTYFVRGCTALYDAIGKTIDYMDTERTKKVLFVITTDGYENASKVYSKEMVKELIDGHKHFEFIYLGANIDSYAEGAKIGIKKENIANYEQSSNGVKKMFAAVGKACDCSYMDMELSDDWKKELS